MTNLPISEGIYEWFNFYNEPHYVKVENLNNSIGDTWLVVFWDNKYWSIEEDWPKRWGKKIGDFGCVSDKYLYTTPVNNVLKYP